MNRLEQQLPSGQPNERKDTESEIEEEDKDEGKELRREERQLVREQETPRVLGSPREKQLIVPYKPTWQRTYQVGQEAIGKGRSAHVYQAIHLPTKESVAIKKIDRTWAFESGMLPRVQNEVALHRMLVHQHITHMHEAFCDDTHIYIVMELCDGGNLKSFLSQTKLAECKEEVIYSIIFQIALGIEYLHTNHVLHRDLKMSNILLCMNSSSSSSSSSLNSTKKKKTQNDRWVKNVPTIKISDFGLAVQIQNEFEEHFTFCGTPNYVAPEVICEKSASSYPSDMWSFGCILHFLLHGTYPFEGSRVSETLENICQSRRTHRPTTSTLYGITRLVENLLEKTPSKRMTIQDFVHCFAQATHDERKLKNHSMFPSLSPSPPPSKGGVNENRPEKGLVSSTLLVEKKRRRKRRSSTRLLLLLLQQRKQQPGFTLSESDYFPSEDEDDRALGKTHKIHQQDKDNQNNKDNKEEEEEEDKDKDKCEKHRHGIGMDDSVTLGLNAMKWLRINQVDSTMDVNPSIATTTPDEKRNLHSNKSNKSNNSNSNNSKNSNSDDVEHDEHDEHDGGGAGSSSSSSCLSLLRFPSDLSCHTLGGGGGGGGNSTTTEPTHHHEPDASSSSSSSPSSSTSSSLSSSSWKPSVGTVLPGGGCTKGTLKDEVLVKKKGDVVVVVHTNNSQEQHQGAMILQATVRLRPCTDSNAYYDGCHRGLCHVWGTWQAQLLEDEKGSMDGKCLKLVCSDNTSVVYSLAKETVSIKWQSKTRSDDKDEQENIDQENQENKENGIPGEKEEKEDENGKVDAGRGAVGGHWKTATIQLRELKEEWTTNKTKNDVTTLASLIATMHRRESFQHLFLVDVMQQVLLICLQRERELAVLGKHGSTEWGDIEFDCQSCEAYVMLNQVYHPLSSTCLKTASKSKAQPEEELTLPRQPNYARTERRRTERARTERARATATSTSLTSYEKGTSSREEEKIPNFWEKSVTIESIGKATQSVRGDLQIVFLDGSRLCLDNSAMEVGYHDDENAIHEHFDMGNPKKNIPLNIQVKMHCISLFVQQFRLQQYKKVDDEEVEKEPL